MSTATPRMPAAAPAQAQAQDIHHGPAPAPAATPGRAVSVHIDRLVIDAAVLSGQAFGARDRAVLQAALQAELAALTARDGLGAGLLGGGAMPRLQAGDLAAGPGADAATSPAHLGRALARALYEGLRQ